MDNPMLAFIDLKQAYDRVPLDLLMRKLANYNFSSRARNVIQGLFKDSELYVSLKGRLLEGIPLSRGLLQGSLLSPILFNYFINDLATELNMDCDPLRPRALLYADDIVLLHESHLEMQHLLNQTSRWLSRNGMIISIHKCGVMNNKSHIPLRVGSEELPEVNTYDYLGFPISDGSIDLTQHIRNQVQKATSALNYAKRLCKRFDWPERVRLSIYRTFIRPLLEYGAPYNHYWLTQETSGDLRSLIDNLEKMALDWILHPTVALNNIHLTLDIPSEIDRLEAQAIIFRIKLPLLGRNNFLHNLLANPQLAGGPVRYLSTLDTSTLLTEPVKNLTQLRKRAHDWCMSKILDRELEPRIFPPGRRHLTYGPCNSLWIPDTKTRKEAILWRLCHYPKLVGRRCPLGHPWSRRCVNHCYGRAIPTKPELLELLELSPEHPTPNHLDAVDLTLNYRKYHTFRYIIHQMTMANFFRTPSPYDPLHLRARIARDMKTYLLEEPVYPKNTIELEANCRVARRV
jgi:hypothetical protein